MRKRAKTSRLEPPLCVARLRRQCNRSAASRAALLQTANRTMGARAHRSRPLRNSIASEGGGHLGRAPSHSTSPRVKTLNLPSQRAPCRPRGLSHLGHLKGRAGIGRESSRIITPDSNLLLQCPPNDTDQFNCTSMRHVYSPHTSATIGT